MVTLYAGKANEQVSEKVFSDPEANPNKFNNNTNDEDADLAQAIALSLLECQ